MIKKPFSVIAMVMSFLIVNSAFAEKENVKVSGFGTVATATSDSDRYQFRSDRSQAESAKKGGLAFKPLSLVGVQLDYSVSDNLDFVGQSTQARASTQATVQLLVVILRSSLDSHGSVELLVDEHTCDFVCESEWREGKKCVGTCFDRIT